jgi:predicted Holliday junction resolvase-like endonuclease
MRDKPEHVMSLKEDFENVLKKLQTERDEANLKLHLASMEAKQEFEEAEQQWRNLKAKAADIRDESVETSEEFIANAKIVGEELKDTYRRIAKRLAG